MEYQIVYQSSNQYFEFAKEGIFDFLILPENNTDQLVSTWKVKNSLLVEPFYYFNLFGFRICRIKINEPFQNLQLEMKVKVQKNNVGIPFGNQWDIEACQIQLKNFNFQIDQHIFLQTNKLTYLSHSSIENFPIFSNVMHPYQYLSDLNSAIYNYFIYTPNLTDVHTTAEETINLKKGVCQDYAHVMIAICRHYGIPSRYVSGYLHQGMGYVGAAKMHAWVECYIPGAGWLGFDPTNNLKADEHYIKVSHGCDYSDCAPLKGVIRSNGEQFTDHEVVVQCQ